MAKRLEASSKKSDVWKLYLWNERYEAHQCKTTQQVKAVITVLQTRLGKLSGVEHWSRAGSE